MFGINFSAILMVVVVSAGSLGYYKYKNMEDQVQEVKQINAALEQRDAVQKDTIGKLEKNLEVTTAAMNGLTQRNSEIEGQLNRYMDIFRRHNLTQLAAAKPGLIQNRINKGTKDVFDSIENDSRLIDNLSN